MEDISKVDKDYLDEKKCFKKRVNWGKCNLVQDWYCYHPYTKLNIEPV